MRILLPSVVGGLFSAVLARMWIAINLATWNLPGVVSWLNIPDTQRVWLELGIMLAIALIIFTAGWVAARWSWATGKNASFIKGALCGLSIGAILYLYPLQFWLTLQAQRFVLETATQSLTEPEGVWAIYFIAALTWAGILQWLGLCLFWPALIGGLGGWFSSVLDQEGWGTEPEPQGWRNRLPAYALTLNGALLTAWALSFMPSFAEIFYSQVSRVNFAQDESAFALLVTQSANLNLAIAFRLNLIYLITLVLWAIPLMVTLGWLLRRVGRYQPLHWAGWILWFAAWGLFAFLFAWPVLEQIMNIGPWQPTDNFSLPVEGLAWTFLIGFSALALLMGLLGAPEIQKGIRIEETAEAKWGAALTFSILATAQSFAGFLTFAIVERGQIDWLIGHLLQGEPFVGVAFYIRQLERTFLIATGIVLFLHLIGFGTLAGLTGGARAVGRWLLPSQD
ncbi:MAG: hypothetical protein DDG60_08295 [Anaerolineae bacterium]|nr:MAG: hypothetical protein DDG60_08295 [Anaerolineae bacterium]